MKTSLFANRESPARRIGEILSILFLASLGTVATMTSVPARGHAQTEAQIAVTAPPSTPAR